MRVRPIPKSATGIRGLDEITKGGLPRGRPTLVCGGAGCGKTLLGMEFLFRGAAEMGEPGVLMAFEETKEKLAANAASLGFDFESLVRRNKIALDYVHVESSEIEETGEYDLGGLFARLENHVKKTRAKRVVLDTLEVLFAGLRNEGIIRSELRRLFRWLEARGLTAIITAERGEGAFTRHGLEEYVSDCVILLDHRVNSEISTRRLRIVKFRGSSHGTNEYPFLIDEHGISVLPLSSLGLTSAAPTERVSTGVKALDAMFEGRGYYRASTILVSGTAGTGKTSLAASFVAERCRRGERALYLSLEESRLQIERNLQSVGIPLARWTKKGLLTIESVRPTTYGLEGHLTALHKKAEESRAASVVLDPVTSLLQAGQPAEARSLLTRLIDMFKNRGVTVMMTSLTPEGSFQESSTVDISSLVDTWIVLGVARAGGERNRTLQVVKSRGMNHSNQVRELILSNQGLRLADAYLGAEGILTGSARLAREAEDQAREVERSQAAERDALNLEGEERALAAQMASLQSKLDTLKRDRETLSRAGRQREVLREETRRRMALSRRAPPSKQRKDNGHARQDLQ